MRRVGPSTSVTCGRVACKSKNPSGSISAKRSASQVLARYPPASDAPWPPSFQPRNAEIRTGARSVGRATTRSSSAIGQVYVRPPEKRRQGHRPHPDRSPEDNVDEHQPPRQMRAPLELAEAHLREQQDEYPDGEHEQARRTFAPRAEVAEAEQERAEEDRDDGAVHVDDRLEPPEPIDVLSLPTAGMRARGGRERTADDEREAGNHESDTEPAKLERDQRLRASDDRGPHFEGENRRAAEKRDRKQQMQHHDRPAQVARHREQSDGSLEEGAEKHNERELN